MTPYKICKFWWPTYLCGGWGGGGGGWGWGGGVGVGGWWGWGGCGWGGGGVGGAVGLIGGGWGCKHLIWCRNYPNRMTWLMKLLCVSCSLSAVTIRDWAHRLCQDILHEQACMLTHWGRDKMAAIFADVIFICIFLMKMFEFRLRFDWGLFPRVQLTIFQHWFR